MNHPIWLKHQGHRGSRWTWNWKGSLKLGKERQEPQAEGFGLPCSSSLKVLEQGVCEVLRTVHLSVLCRVLPEGEGLDSTWASREGLGGSGTE